MAVLEILEAPDPRLNTVCHPIERIDAGLLRLLDDMLETMYQAPGIGLAAPQVGVLRRAFVVDLSEDDEPEPMALINPELVWRSETTNTAEEGCLSLPKQFGEVTRADQVRLRYLDRDGQRREISAEGLFARCLQHELDHLDGVLFIDHLSALKRNLILRRLIKARRSRLKVSA
ncbi:MAG: peptide deformylase [Geminicoccaceae bacterium]